MSKNISNIAIDQNNDLIIVISEDNYEDNIRIYGVNENRFATEYDELGTYIPFIWN